MPARPANICLPNVTKWERFQSRRMRSRCSPTTTPCVPPQLNACSASSIHIMYHSRTRRAPQSIHECTLIRITALTPTDTRCSLASRSTVFDCLHGCRRGRGPPESPVQPLQVLCRCLWRSGRQWRPILRGQFVTCEWGLRSGSSV